MWKHRGITSEQVQFDLTQFFWSELQFKQNYWNRKCLWNLFKVSQNHSSSALVNIWICKLHIIFRDFSWRFEWNNSISKLPQFLLVKISTGSNKKRQCYQKNMAAILFKISSKISRLLVSKQDEQVTFSIAKK